MASSLQRSRKGPSPSPPPPPSLPLPLPLPPHPPPSLLTRSAESAPLPVLPVLAIADQGPQAGNCTAARRLPGEPVLADPSQASQSSQVRRLFGGKSSSSDPKTVPTLRQASSASQKGSDSASERIIMIESDLSVQMLSPINKRVCYVRMLVLGLYLSVEQTRSEPQDHGWNG
jgi:hypothetical protein